MSKEQSSMRDLVIAVGGPLSPGENRKSWLARVAREAGLSPRVARAAFYQETTSRKAAAKLKAAAGNHEVRNLARQFEGLATSLEVRDEAFHRAHTDALRDIARTLRSIDSALRGANAD